MRSASTLPFLPELCISFAERLDQLLELGAVLLLDARQLMRKIRNCGRKRKRKRKISPRVMGSRFHLARCNRDRKEKEKIVSSGKDDDDDDDGRLFRKRIIITSAL